MENMTEHYERLIDEEDGLIKQLDTCEGIMGAVMNYITTNGSSLHPQTLEELIGKVHTVKSDLLIELLHTRLEKALIAGEIKPT